jgi:hypothetical protein
MKKRLVKMRKELVRHIQYLEDVVGFRCSLIYEDKGEVSITVDWTETTIDDDDFKPTYEIATYSDSGEIEDVLSRLQQVFPMQQVDCATLFAANEIDY